MGCEQLRGFHVAAHGFFGLQAAAASGNPGFFIFF
jgi:hypothetical protein